MTVCVFGGGGFLGSHVVDYLVQKSNEVRVFDLARSPWTPDTCQLIEGDICDLDAVNDAVKGCHTVYNFAAIADLNDALRRPTETIKTNILGNNVILNACVDQSVKKFVLASSVYVQGQHGGFYRCSKQAAENYTKEFKRVFDLDYLILRYGSLYGPRSGPSNGLYKIISQALQSGIVSYDGSQEASREYVHVLDAAKATVDIASSSTINTSILISGQEKIKILELLEMLTEMLGFDSPVHCSNERPEGHYVRTPYGTRFDEERKYSPSYYYDLGQGLLDLVEEIQRDMSANN